MAKRPAAAAAEEEEIFTDLDGGGEIVDPLETPSPRDRESTLVPQGDREKIEDADLEVADDDEDLDPDVDPDADPDADPDLEADPDPEPAPVKVEGVDPRDVQILALEAKNLENAKAALTDASKRAEADMAAAEKNMKTAKEAGDTDADIAATKAWGAAMTAKTTADAELKNLTGDEQNLVRKAQALMAKAPINPETGKRDIHYRPPAGEAVEKPRGSKLAPKFIKQNAWFNNTKYKTQRERLLQLDRGLEAEGVLDKNDPKYFEELTKRFNREHPGLARGLDGKPIATGQRRRQAGATIPGSGGGGGPVAPARGAAAAGKIRLTNADLDEMKTFGLDPTDRKVKEQWLIEKRALARQGA